MIPTGRNFDYVITEICLLLCLVNGSGADEFEDGPYMGCIISNTISADCI